MNAIMISLCHMVTPGQLAKLSINSRVQFLLVAVSCFALVFFYSMSVSTGNGAAGFIVTSCNVAIV